MAPPFRTAEFDLLFREGISREGSLIDSALEYEVVSRSGAWFTYEGENIGQGRENVRLFLKENTDIRDRIEQQVLGCAGLLKTDDAEAGDQGSADET